MEAKIVVDMKHFCVQRMIYLSLNKRFVPCTIFIVAVMPFLALNLFVYQTGDREEYFYHLHKFSSYFHSGTTKVRKRFLQHLIGRNDTELDLIPDKAQFYSPEREQAEELEIANRLYKEACVKSLPSTTADNVTNLMPVFHNHTPNWQQQLLMCKNVTKNKFFLTSALQVRIYKADKAKWTIKELKQWFHYMFWAGVEHIYICDHFRFLSEQLRDELKTYVDSNLVTYINWHHIRIPMTAQVACYQYIIDKYGRDSVWQLAVDMDEYPFMPQDTAEGFIVRYLHTLKFAITEVSLHNYLMLGHGDRSRTMAIERITRMTPEPANDLDKPLYRPLRVVASIHHNLVQRGKRLEAIDDEIRLLHYWGSRISNFGPDSPGLKYKTVEYTALRDTLANIVRQSLLSFGENDVFSNTTGP